MSLSRADFERGVRRWVVRGASVGLVLSLVAACAIVITSSNPGTPGDFAAFVLVCCAGAAALSGMLYIRWLTHEDIRRAVGIGTGMMWMGGLFGAIVIAMVVAKYVAGW